MDKKELIELLWKYDLSEIAKKLEPAKKEIAVLLRELEIIKIEKLKNKYNVKTS